MHTYRLENGRKPRRGRAPGFGSGRGLTVGALPKGRDAPIDLGVLEAKAFQALPRKEVIQPHVPVRLPCYDFVLVASLTLDACLPCGLAQRLQVLPTPMT